MKTNHTPTPWQLRLTDSRQFEIIVTDGEIKSVIAKGYDAGLCPEHGGTLVGNAEFILRACNHHDEVVDLLRKCYDVIPKGILHDELTKTLRILS